MRRRSLYAGSIALVLVIPAGLSARAGTAYFSHSIDVPPRIAARNLALYEHVAAVHGQAPAEFDHRHPLIGRALSDPAYDQEMLSRWEDHPWSFEHHHRELWRVLDGEMLWRNLHGGLGLSLGHDEAQTLGQGIGPGPGMVTPMAVSPPTGSGTDSPPGGPRGPGPGGSSVPEPSSGILMVLGTIAGAIAVARHRRRQPDDRG